MDWAIGAMKREERGAVGVEDRRAEGKIRFNSKIFPVF